MNMSKHEILITRYGEMADLISCLAIFEGRAEQKRKKRAWSFQDAIALR
jgi:hypothetical protein